MRIIPSTVCAGLVLMMNFIATAQPIATPNAPILQNGPVREVTRAFLLDRIYGAWIGMLIGGLEGLPHEFKYKEQPREALPEFTFLEKGARSDDDNDFEWTHLWFMDKEGSLKLPYPRLVEIWKMNMNQGIWVANKRARELMDQGIVPPETGSTPLNQHAHYNLSGQFCVESYGMIAPGMPQAAAELGLHYARIAVSGEPLQAAQYWTSLISLMAFHEGPIDAAIDAALAGVDPASALAEAVADARRLHGEYPRDWKAAREAIHQKWVKRKNWNMNSTPSNGALVLLALLYGEGDFYKTLQYAMALGYDADCNAATAGAVLGMRLGFRHISGLTQFRMPDRYVNSTRPSLPAECKVSEQAKTLMRLAERVILGNGGQQLTVSGKPAYRVRLQKPALLEPLPSRGKPRLLILTDIGGDPDDQQSMIRLMLYANEFELEGLIASASGTPGELKEKVTKPHLIREIVEAYGKVHPNLVRHAEGYPNAEHLLALVKTGNPHRGREGVGESLDTEASRWIMQVADREDTRPLNIAIWGGQTDLAQALWRVRKDRGTNGLAQFIRQLRIYDIGDQDRIVEWLWQEFPGLFYVIGQAPRGRDMREAVYRGLYLGGDESLVARAWMEEHIRQNHGPLGALYPPRTWTAPNPHSAIKEGDTPSWFFFLPNGLGDPAHPEWGGWGGRFTNAQARIFRDAHDTVDTVTDARSTVWRWRSHFQNDFAARLDWCVVDAFSKANHNPIAVLNGDRTKNIVPLTARRGETVPLSAEGTSDPDGNKVELRWWFYPEPGTLRDKGDKVNLSGTTGTTTSMTAPEITNPATIHVILEARDNGEPPLWSYRRAVVKIE